MAQERHLEKGISYQIFTYTVVSMIFFMAVFSNTLIFYITAIVLILLGLIYFLKNREKLDTKRRIGFFILLNLAIIPLFASENILNTVITRFFLTDPIGLTMNFDGLMFWALYGLLGFFAIVSEFIVVFYLFKNRTLASEEEDLGMWSYFAMNPSIKKAIYLFSLLSVASIVEEIVFRFILINIGIKYNFPIPLIVIVSSLVFGIAHFKNGNSWIFVPNPTFAGIMFSIAFLQMGLFSAWLLHFFWNFLVVFQMVIPVILEKTLQDKYMKER